MKTQKSTRTVETKTPENVEDLKRRNERMCPDTSDRLLRTLVRPRWHRLLVTAVAHLLVCRAMCRGRHSRFGRGRTRLTIGCHDRPMQGLFFRTERVEAPRRVQETDRTFPKLFVVCGSQGTSGLHPWVFYADTGLASGI